MTESPNAMVVAPHADAAHAGAAVLEEGGNAIEAMVAAAATIAVTYPHMTGLGGDVFWLIHEPGRPVTAIDASGGAAAAALPAFYRRLGLDAIPARGPLAANTVAGAVAGWAAALELSRGRWGGRLPLSRLLADAIHRAEHGVPVTRSHVRSIRAKFDELRAQPGFDAQFLAGGAAPAAGALLRQPALAATLGRLARRGLDDFYRGELAREIAAGLAACGSPLALSDLNGFRARQVAPLSLAHRRGTLYNVPRPTQGLVSLMILGILDRIGLERVEPDGADHVHYTVEATKQAFAVRDARLLDLRDVDAGVADCLTPEFLDARRAVISPARARPWPGEAAPGDTVWMGAIDASGRAVSFIQSLYHEFGSGVVLADTGIVWQNRGSTFSLRPGARNAPAPGRKPFHTLNPALAHLHDGRVMVYGSMGGDGQPQTQAAVFTRAVVYGQDLGRAVSAPRWLLGRTWGRPSNSLKLEARFDASIVEELKARGHEVELLAAYDEAVGHAGAIAREPSGRVVGASDPRSDGAAAVPEHP